jgi:hypothetical protein
MNKELDLDVTLNEVEQKFTLTVKGPSQVIPGTQEIDYLLGGDVSFVNIFEAVEDFEYGDDNTEVTVIDLHFEDTGRSRVSEDHVYVLAVTQHSGNGKRKRKILTMNKNGVRVPTLFPAQSA